MKTVVVNQYPIDRAAQTFINVTSMDDVNFAEFSFLCVKGVLHGAIYEEYIPLSNIIGISTSGDFEG